MLLGRGGPGKGTFKTDQTYRSPRTLYDTPESADGVGSYHCGATFSYFYKVMMFRRSSPVFEKGQEDPSQFYPNPEMMTEQITLENICKHMKKKKVAKRHQQGFTKGKFMPDPLEDFPHKRSG